MSSVKAWGATAQPVATNTAVNAATNKLAKPTLRKDGAILIGQIPCNVVSVGAITDGTKADKFVPLRINAAPICLTTAILPQSSKAPFPASSFAQDNNASMEKLSWSVELDPEQTKNYQDFHDEIVKQLSPMKNDLLRTKTAKAGREYSEEEFMDKVRSSLAYSPENKYPTRLKFSVYLDDRKPEIKRCNLVEDGSGNCAVSDVQDGDVNDIMSKGVHCVVKLKATRHALYVGQVGIGINWYATSILILTNKREADVGAVDFGDLPVLTTSSNTNGNKKPKAMNGHEIDEEYDNEYDAPAASPTFSIGSAGNNNGV
jgi:hypothetical protein